MKRTTFLVLLAALAPKLPAGCGGDAPTSAEAVATSATASLAIEGMTCASCAVTVKTALRKLDGIASVEVDVEGGAATVRYDAALLDAQRIAAAVTQAGYPATVRTAGGG